MVPTPMVIALRGTLFMVPNLKAASALVIGSNVIKRVTEFTWDPGSLKPIWPFRPMPSN